MKPMKRKKKIPGNPAGAGTEAIKIYCNGKLTQSFTLTEESPRLIYYVENEAAAAKLDSGLSEEEALAAKLERATRYIVNSSYYYLGKLAELDMEAAKNVFSDMLQNMEPTRIGNGKTEFDITTI